MKPRELGQTGLSIPEVGLGMWNYRYSLLDRTIQTELIQFCRQHNVAVIASSPLGTNFRRMLDADRNNSLGEIARETQKTKAQVALNWCLLQPEVVVIPKRNPSSMQSKTAAHRAGA